MPAPKFNKIKWGRLMDNCVFCDEFMKIRERVAESEYCVAFFDGFPVSKGHILIISKRHAPTFFDLTNDEQCDMVNLLSECKKIIDKKYNPDGYNVGLNCGTAAGQTVKHVHMHLIPRYFGDVENPKGGVRGVIPNKKLY